MNKKFFIFMMFLFMGTFNFNKTLAKEITNETKIFINDVIASSKLFDNKESTYIKIKNDDTIKISANSSIDGLYIVYEIEGKKGCIDASGEKIEIGLNGFAHEYINVAEKIKGVSEITIKYESEAKIADIYVFDEGDLPEFVEVWNPPCKNADIVLLSSHADDEQLFFLGLLPTYVARGARVQVIYFTHHNNQTIRYHELLHGLYTVGIRNYPIIGIVPDAYSTTLEGAIRNMNNSGITEDDAIDFYVKMFRKLKPQVIVGHDEKGEYSHGQHILNTYVLKKALELSNNENYGLESVEKYGVWNPKKVYLHLYKENEITMDYDIPLDYFDGKTAYEVSKEGYKTHNTQQWTWFTKWINGNNNSYIKAIEIKTYSPLNFGLYYSSVGEDVQKNDMLENIVLYSEQERIEQERIERERIAEQERIKEEARRNEERIKEENRLLMQQKRKRAIVMISVLIIATIILCVIHKIKIKRGKV